MPQKQRDVLMPAYLLHMRPYRETSVIADFFTQHHGKISAVVRGARRQKGKYKAQFQPFNPLLISWMGKHELVTMTQIESAGVHNNLKGNRLICGLYLNELLVRLLPSWNGYANLFGGYMSAINDLADSHRQVMPLLRQFEMNLLSEIGYGIDLNHESDGQVSLNPDKHYQYAQGQGFMPLTASPNVATYKGAWLLSMADGHFDAPEVAKAAKRLMRSVLTPLMGNKPLKSRELLSPLKQE